MMEVDDLVSTLHAGPNLEEEGVEMVKAKDDELG